MNNATFNFTEVGKCSNSVAEKVDYSNPDNAKKVIKGDLGIFIQIKTGLLLFKMGEFEYGINPNDQILYEDSDPDFKLVVCLDADPSNCWFLKINQNTQLLFFVLSERCKLIHRNAARVIVSETESVTDSKGNPKKQVTTRSDHKEEKKESTEKLLIESSKMLSLGLMLAGKAVSRGLQKLGSIIAKKVEPADAIHVSEDSKQLIKKSVGASQKLLQITTDQVAALFRVAKNEVVKIVNKLEESEKGKEWSQKEGYSSIKKGLMTGLHVITNIYEGVTEGMSEASVGMLKGTNEVVSKKYGPDAAEVGFGVVEGYRNIAKIYKIPKNEAKKLLKPTDSEIQK